MTQNHPALHDHFFRKMMTNPKVIREFFEQNLPSNIKSVIDFATIKPQKDSFIGDKLKQQITDLLFSVNFNHKQGYIYILIEHQSIPDKLMPFRILKYMVSIMEDHLTKTAETELPVVYPIIFYTGTKPYNYSTDLFDLFGDGKELALEVFGRPYQLVNILKASDSGIDDLLWYGVLASTMKHIRNNDFLPVFKQLIHKLKLIEKQGGIDYIYVVLEYIVRVAEISSKEEFVKTITFELSKIDEKKVMTIAEQFKQEGIQKGKQEGIIQAERAIAIRLLDIGMDIEQVAQLTELPTKEIQLLISIK